MKLDEYQQWKDDKRVGKCPFCGMPGWIVGDEEWCEHYIGSDDLFNGTDPYFPIIAGEPFETLIGLVKNLEEKDKTFIQNVLDHLSNNDRELVQAAMDLSDSFWKQFLVYEVLEAELSETLFDTVYYAYFVSSYSEAQTMLDARVYSALKALQPYASVDDTNTRLTLDQ